MKKINVSLKYFYLVFRMFIDLVILLEYNKNI